MALSAGDRLGRYRILRQLGAGAMGEVYLAEDPQIERQLAIKTVRIVADSTHDADELQERLIREARAAGRLVHPHIVTLFDAGRSEGVFYLAFEFVDGVDLSHRLRGTPPLSVGEALRIARETAEGLHAAHEVGIVHRDVKPANILLDAAGRVKISDFGIAKMVGQKTELTQTGSVVGSPHYLSPEQVRGEPLDGRSDLFSLGVVLYEMLTRLRPFEGETITTLVYQILSRDPIPLEETRPELPPNLGRVVSRLLAKEAGGRFANGREAADALAECERELPAALLAQPAAGSAGEIAARRASAAQSSSRPSAPIPPPPPAAPPPPSPGAAVPASPPSPLPPPSATPLDTAATSLLTGKDTAQVPPAPAGSRVAGPPAAPAPVSKAGRSWLAWAVAGILLLAVLGVGGFWAWRTFATPQRPDLGERAELGQTHETPVDIGSDPSDVDPPPPVESEWTEVSTGEESAGEESRSPSDTLSSTDRPPVEEPPVRRDAPREETPASTFEETPVRVDPGPATSDPPPVTPIASETSPPVVDPVPEEARDEPTVEDAPPAEPPEPLEPEIEELPVSRTLETSLSLALDVTPEDTFVLMKEISESRFISIGRAEEWSGKKDARYYELPGPGEYYLRFRRQGHREVTWRLIADHGPGATPIVLRMP